MSLERDSHAKLEHALDDLAHGRAVRCRNLAAGWHIAEAARRTGIPVGLRLLCEVVPAGEAEGS